MKINRDKYAASEEFIRTHLSYDKITGIITWIKRPHRFSKVMAGDIAGCRTVTYVKIKAERRQLFGHWVAWFLATGAWPNHEIDHRNSDKLDNRWENLRQSTRAENTRNRRPYSRGGTGLKGAYTHESLNGRWFGQIVVDGNQIYLGRFDTELEAHQAYAQEAAKHHGDFARTE